MFSRHCFVVWEGRRRFLQCYCSGVGDDALGLLCAVYWKANAAAPLPVQIVGDVPGRQQTVAPHLAYCHIHGRS